MDKVWLWVVCALLCGAMVTGLFALYRTNKQYGSEPLKNPVNFAAVHGLRRSNRRSLEFWNFLAGIASGCALGVP